jgi:hypothetical protein
MMDSPSNNPSNDDQSAWDAFLRQHELQNARVVAILDEDGGAIVETHLVLEIHEGRMETYSTDGRERTTSTLDYGLAFGPKSDKVGDRHVGYPAAIVIKGAAENGRIVEIRGKGFIGQDEFGQLDGVFHDVPSIYVPSEEDLREHVQRETGEFGPEPQGEFVLATYGRAQDWS